MKIWRDAMQLHYKTLGTENLTGIKLNASRWLIKKKKKKPSSKPKKGFPPLR